jgi:hypothetical protein
MTARKHCSPNLMHSSAAMQEGMSAISLRRVTLEAHLHSQAGDDTVAYQGLPEHPAYQWTQLVPHCDFSHWCFQFEVPCTRGTIKLTFAHAYVLTHLKLHAQVCFQIEYLLSTICFQIWRIKHTGAFKLKICFECSLSSLASYTRALLNWTFASKYLLSSLKRHAQGRFQIDYLPSDICFQVWDAVHQGAVKLSLCLRILLSHLKQHSHECFQVEYLLLNICFHIWSVVHTSAFKLNICFQTLAFQFRSALHKGTLKLNLCFQAFAFEFEV